MFNFFCFDARDEFSHFFIGYQTYELLMSLRRVVKITSISYILPMKKS